LTWADVDFDAMCSLERLMALHARGLREHRGLDGVRDPGCPEGTLGSAKLAVSYDELGESHPHLLFGCYLLYYFATKQCFVDGNKRIAWTSLCEVLGTIDLTIDASAEEAYAFVIGIAEGRTRDIEAVVDWVSKRLKSLPPPAPSSSGGRTDRFAPRRLIEL